MDMMARQFVCKCFYTDNYFVKQYYMHVYYKDDHDFRERYVQALKNVRCYTEKDFQCVLAKIKEEKERRENVGKEYLKRKAVICRRYERLHPEIFQLQEYFLDPRFVKLVDFCKAKARCKQDVLSHIHLEDATEVYSFPVFRREFCEKFMEEIASFEKSDCPKGRPNTMNQYGVLLNELGFDDNFLNPLREEYLHHITKHLYPQYGGGDLDSHKAFVVKYKMGEDLDLSYHYDNAEVTLNVSMGREFEGGTLYFGNMHGVDIEDTECTQYEHASAQGLLHRGQHMHGAMKILSGERYNLIIWMRASKIRNQLCPMCKRKPELVEVEGLGDGFTQKTVTVDVCSVV